MKRRVQMIPWTEAPLRYLWSLVGTALHISWSFESFGLDDFYGLGKSFHAYQALSDGRRWGDVFLCCKKNVGQLTNDV